MRCKFYALLLLFVNYMKLNTLVTLALTPAENKSLVVLYNSKAGSDGNFQESLLRGAFLGLVEADSDSDLSPSFVDFGVKNVSQEIDSIVASKTKTIVSLLSTAQLDSFCKQFKTEIQESGISEKIAIFTPRILPSALISKYSNILRLVTLQPTDEIRAIALIHRIGQVQTHMLTPILDDASQLPLLNLYHRLAPRFLDGANFTAPIFVFESTQNRTLVVNSTRIESFLDSHPKPNDAGILLLSANWLPDPKDGFWSSTHSFRWFAHAPVQEFKAGSDILFGLYSVQYVGSKNWDSPLRRNVIRDIGNSSDPTPNVISVLLAFDTATVAASHAKLGKVSSISKGLSGKIEFDSAGFRTGEQNFIGISALSQNSSNFALLLQNSSWILEESVQIVHDNHTMKNEIFKFEVGTSSILPRDDLLKFAKEKLTLHKKECETTEFEVIAHDPFNQQTYKYLFKAQDLPYTLIVPNQFGYGLKLLCKTHDETELRIQTACTTTMGSVISGPLHCYNSNIQIRKKRGANLNRKFQNSFYSYNNRDDNLNNMLYMVPPVEVPTTSMPFYMAPSSTAGSYAAAEGSTATEEAVTEAPTTHAAEPVSKLPDLRGLLKSTLPFVGACVGAATGCSVCVVVLGRLPLGVLPAACTGPCFVTTFANCGGLLGRTFAETTVICTELFRQGRLDLETFLVDAEFGSQLSLESLPTLQMYQKLATPVVYGMRSSELVSNVVEFFARPWADHMLYLMGRRSKVSYAGLVVHSLGMVACNILARISTWFELTVSSTLYISLFTVITTVFILLKCRLRLRYN